MNIFKTMPPKQYSTPRPRHVNKNEGISTFKSPEIIQVVKKEYIKKESDFPELNTEIKKNGDISSELNYKKASLKETPKVLCEIKKKGWYYIYKNENKELIREYVEKNEIEKEYELDVHEEMNIAIQKMQYNWNNYKETYIELYGEDVYEYMHKMPNYEHIPDYYEEEYSEEEYSEEEYEYDNY